MAELRAELKLGPRRIGYRLGVPTACTIAALDNHRERQAKERAEAAEVWRENVLVFPSAYGTPTDHREYRKSLQRATKAAGLGEDWAPHELRHSCISILSEAGEPETALADLAGHADTRMVSRVYRHRVTPTVAVAVGPVDALFPVAQ